MENLTKEQVAVKVTDKNREHIAKTLKMFGEKLASSESLTFRYLIFNTEYPKEGKVFYGSDDTEGKKLVSHKQLRTILAKEHLKANDFIIATIGKSEYIVEVESICEDKAFIDGYRYLCVNKKYKHSAQTGGSFTGFKRYATKEEIELFEQNIINTLISDFNYCGKKSEERCLQILNKGELQGVEIQASKELEVGKWYKWVDGDGRVYIFNHQEKGKSYGWFRGEWNTCDWTTGGFINKKGLIELSNQEIESALIEEAKRRGFVNGSIGNNSNIHDIKFKNCELFFKNEFEFNEKENTLRIVLDDEKTWVVFKDGKWAEIIEQDKFAELKEAHKNGAVIQFKGLKGDWIDADPPRWIKRYEYRIKPEEKPKVGDVVKCWYNDSPTEFLIKIADAEDLTIFPNIKVVSQQQVNDLLFNKAL